MPPRAPAETYTMPRDRLPLGLGRSSQDLPELVPIGSCRSRPERLRGELGDQPLRGRCRRSGLAAGEWAGGRGMRGIGHSRKEGKTAPVVTRARASLAKGKKHHERKETLSGFDGSVPKAWLARPTCRLLEETCGSRPSSPISNGVAPLGMMALGRGSLYFAGPFRRDHVSPMRPGLGRPHSWGLARAPERPGPDGTGLDDADRKLLAFAHGDGVQPRVANRRWAVRDCKGRGNGGPLFLDHVEDHAIHAGSHATFTRDVDATPRLDHLIHHRRVDACSVGHGAAVGRPR